MTREAALFDWDGTLWDSLDALRSSWQVSTEEVLGRRYPDTPEEEEAVFTLPGALLWPPLASSEQQLAALKARFIEEYLARTETVDLFPGIGEALAGLHAAGMGIAVVTAKSRFRFDLAVEAAGLTDIIDVTICFEDSQGAVKPDPAPVLLACERLGVAPSRAVMVGDTPVDVEAGLRAGTTAVGVAWGAWTAELLLEAGAQAVAHHPADLARLLPQVLASSAATT
ncbi:MAG TPA: HAD family hydrolase [Acidimicrobiia bacterium]|nr:HAD family hydrolase [Acidimicrobiia bacterium]